MTKKKQCCKSKKMQRRCKEDARMMQGNRKRKSSTEKCRSSGIEIARTVRHVSHSTNIPRGKIAIECMRAIKHWVKSYYKKIWRDIKVQNINVRTCWKREQIKLVKASQSTGKIENCGRTVSHGSHRLNIPVGKITIKSVGIKKHYITRGRRQTTNKVKLVEHE